MLKNPFDPADSPDAWRPIEPDATELTIRLTRPVRAVRNLRTQKSFGDVSSFTDRFGPCEANLYEFILAK